MAETASRGRDSKKQQRQRQRQQQNGRDSKSRGRVMSNTRIFRRSESSESKTISVVVFEGIINSIKFNIQSDQVKTAQPDQVRQFDYSILINRIKAA